MSLLNNWHLRPGLYNDFKGNNHTLGLFGKKAVFALLRATQEVAFYESKQKGSGNTLKLLHVGDFSRGRDFIERLYGYLPEGQVIGKRFAWPNPDCIDSFNIDHDVVMIEINRLYAEKFRHAGYLTIPEWVVFGREVVKNPEARYAEAHKSLKSDLNKIRRSDLQIFITKNHEDFSLFYEKMYLPYVLKRFGDRMIAKSRRRLKRDFLSGFLMLVRHEKKSIAGALVRIDDDQVTETTLGVLDGAEEFSKMGVSGLIDYHLHEWAAANNKSFINVGHTRPFPLDGIFFNKRKWLMSVMPDYDGVMDMAVKFSRENKRIAAALKNYPFVFQNRSGLGIFYTHIGPGKVSMGEIRKIWRQLWVKGLEHLIILSPQGYQEKAIAKARKLFGQNIRLLTKIGQAVELQKGNKICESLE